MTKIPWKKKASEKKVAEEFIKLLQTHSGVKLVNLIPQEPPDFMCHEWNSEQPIGIEVTFTEDLDHQIAYFNTGKKKPFSTRTFQDNVSSFEDAVEILLKRLTQKANIQYGLVTCLVIWQTSRIWDIDDWHLFSFERFNQKSLELNLRKYYRGGVWLITSNHQSYPYKNELVCLVQPHDSFLTKQGTDHKK